MSKRAPKGTPTDLNIWSMARVANGRRTFPNQLEPTAVAGIRRCVKAGLVEVVSRTELRITDAGVEAIKAYNVRVSAYPHPQYLAEIA